MPLTTEQRNYSCGFMVEWKELLEGIVGG